MSDTSNSGVVQIDDVGDIITEDNLNRSEVNSPPEGLGLFTSADDKQRSTRVMQKIIKMVICILPIEVTHTG